jgi:hypothetical protein
MSKIIKLTESDLTRIVKRIIIEGESETQDSDESQHDYDNMKKLLKDLDNVLNEYEFLHSRDVIYVLDTILKKYYRKLVTTMYK